MFKFTAGAVTGAIAVGIIWFIYEAEADARHQVPYGVKPPGS